MNEGSDVINTVPAPMLENIEDSDSSIEMLETAQGNRKGIVLSSSDTDLTVDLFELGSVSLEDEILNSDCRCSPFPSSKGSKDETSESKASLQSPTSTILLSTIVPALR